MAIDRKKLYETAAASLLAEYESIKASGVDTGMKGTAGESILTKWAKKWLPEGVSLINGSVISEKEGPTTQRDCLLFDRMHSPIFYDSIVPIEGILGAIEINLGKAKYEKLLHDAEKLSEIARLSRHKGYRPSVVMSGQPLDGEITDEMLDQNLKRYYGPLSKPLLLIYTEDIEGDLVTLGTRIADHNKKIGVYESIDGVFVLKKGILMHHRGTGITVHRQANSYLFSQSTPPGRVLFHLQNIILKYLGSNNLSYPAGFDEYVFQGAYEEEVVEVVSDKEYKEQPDRTITYEI